MATVTAMAQPAPPRGPPPSRRPIGRPAPPQGPPPRGRPAPPPLPPNQLSGTKRPAGVLPSDGKKMRRPPITIRAPVSMRDVTAFEKKHQVGEGTFGSVFLGVDKKTGEMVALKRINTKQEENGFPITAIREVKILKALNHKNIVDLKEIVTSKGAFRLDVRKILSSLLYGDFNSRTSLIPILLVYHLREEAKF
uniref:Cyclin-dependent kinase 2 homolog n=1 Tax=Ditylum brightwellii TaxID=49249 RepID=A0A7S1YYY6_9STRA|mmetsp:Transcript_20740/g.30820  ORF Transcript_20740/g.30820 Transcript_20740/m.30820 type:complete len:194 (+) Transcript_20740:487-1068(+)